MMGIEIAVRLASLGFLWLLQIIASRRPIWKLEVNHENETQIRLRQILRECPNYRNQLCDPIAPIPIETRFMNSGFKKYDRSDFHQETLPGLFLRRLKSRFESTEMQ